MSQQTERMSFHKFNRNPLVFNKIRNINQNNSIESDIDEDLNEMVPIYSK